MAKVYITFGDPRLFDGKLYVTAKVSVIGGTQVVPEIEVNSMFDGEPTAALINSTIRALALAEVNVYLTGKLQNNDIVIFCAPS